MVQSRTHRKLSLLYNKIKDARKWIDLKIEERPALAKVDSYNGMGPEKTVKAWLIEQGYEVRRRADANIDYDIRVPGREWASIEIKADILRPGQEGADYYAIILYPRSGGRAIIITTLGVEKNGE